MNFADAARPFSDADHPGAAGQARCIAARCATLQFSAAHRSAHEFRGGCRRGFTIAVRFRGARRPQKLIAAKRSARNAETTERRERVTRGGGEERQGQGRRKKGGHERITIKTEYERRRDCRASDSTLRLLSVYLSLSLARACSSASPTVIARDRHLPGWTEWCHNSGRIRVSNCSAGPRVIISRAESRPFKSTEADAHARNRPPPLLIGSNLFLICARARERACDEDAKNLAGPRRD